MLKLRLGGDDEFLPAVSKFQMTAQGTVEPLGAVLFHHSFAVGRVAHDKAAVGGQAQLCGVAVLKIHAIGHTGLAGIGKGQRYAGGVIVRTQNAVLAGKLLVLGLFLGLRPHLRCHPRIFLGRKVAIQARGPVLGNEGRFDGNGATAAEGIPEEISAPVAGQLDHAGSEGLMQRGIVAHGAVATLMQAGAGGIQRQSYLIVQDGKVELKLHAGLRQPGHTVLFTQAAGGRLFDDGLTVRNAHELAVEAVTLYGKLAVLGNKILQIGLIHSLKQLFKGLGGKLRQHHHHPFGSAQGDIGLGHGGSITGKQHPAVLHPYIFHTQPAKLVTGDALQTKKAGGYKLQILHRSSIRG